MKKLRKIILILTLTSAQLTYLNIKAMPSTNTQTNDLKNQQKDNSNKKPNKKKRKRKKNTSDLNPEKYFIRDITKNNLYYYTTLFYDAIKNYINTLSEKPDVNLKKEITDKLELLISQYISFEEEKHNNSSYDVMYTIHTLAEKITNIIYDSNKNEKGLISKDEAIKKIDDQFNINQKCFVEKSKLINIEDKKDENGNLIYSKKTIENNIENLRRDVKYMSKLLLITHITQLPKKEFENLNEIQLKNKICEDSKIYIKKQKSSYNIVIHFDDNLVEYLYYILADKEAPPKIKDFGEEIYKVVKERIDQKNSTPFDLINIIKNDTKKIYTYIKQYIYITAFEMYNEIQTEISTQKEGRVLRFKKLFEDKLRNIGIEAINQDIIQDTTVIPKININNIWLVVINSILRKNKNNSVTTYEPIILLEALKTLIPLQEQDMPMSIKIAEEAKMDISMLKYLMNCDKPDLKLNLENIIPDESKGKFNEDLIEYIKEKLFKKIIDSGECTKEDIKDLSEFIKEEVNKILKNNSETNEILAKDILDDFLYIFQNCIEKINRLNENLNRYQIKMRDIISIYENTKEEDSSKIELEKRYREEYDKYKKEINNIKQNIAQNKKEDMDFYNIFLNMYLEYIDTNSKDIPVSLKNKEENKKLEFPEKIRDELFITKNAYQTAYAEKIDKLVSEFLDTLTMLRNIDGDLSTTGRELYILKTVQCIGNIDLKNCISSIISSEDIGGFIDDIVNIYRINKKFLNEFKKVQGQIKIHNSSLAKTQELVNELNFNVDKTTTEDNTLAFYINIIYPKIESLFKAFDIELEKEDIEKICHKMLNKDSDINLNEDMLNNLKFALVLSLGFKLTVDFLFNNIDKNFKAKALSYSKNFNNQLPAITSKKLKDDLEDILNNLKDHLKTTLNTNLSSNIDFIKKIFGNNFEAKIIEKINKLKCHFNDYLKKFDQYNALTSKYRKNNEDDEEVETEDKENNTTKSKKNKKIKKFLSSDLYKEICNELYSNSENKNIIQKLKKLSNNQIHNLNENQKTTRNRLIEDLCTKIYNNLLQAYSAPLKKFTDENNLFNVQTVISNTIVPKLLNENSADKISKDFNSKNSEPINKIIEEKETKKEENFDTYETLKKIQEDIYTKYRDEILQIIKEIMKEIMEDETDKKDDEKILKTIKSKFDLSFYSKNIMQDIYTYINKEYCELLKKCKEKLNKKTDTIIKEKIIYPILEKLYSEYNKPIEKNPYTKLDKTNSNFKNIMDNNISKDMINIKKITNLEKEEINKIIEEKDFDADKELEKIKEIIFTNLQYEFPESTQENQSEKSEENFLDNITTILYSQEIIDIINELYPDILKKCKEKLNKKTDTIIREKIIYPILEKLYSEYDKPIEKNLYTKLGKTSSNFKNIMDNISKDMIKIKKMTNIEKEEMNKIIEKENKDSNTDINWKELYDKFAPEIQEKMKEKNLYTPQIDDIFEKKDKNKIANYICKNYKDAIKKYTKNIQNSSLVDIAINEIFPVIFKKAIDDYRKKLEKKKYIDGIIKKDNHPTNKTPKKFNTEKLKNSVLFNNIKNYNKYFNNLEKEDSNIFNFDIFNEKKDSNIFNFDVFNKKEISNADRRKNSMENIYLSSTPFKKPFNVKMYNLSKLREKNNHFYKNPDLTSLSNKPIDINNISTEKSEKKTENIDPKLVGIYKDVYFTFKYDLSEKIKILFSENIINKEMDPDSLKNTIYDNLDQDEIVVIYNYIFIKYDKTIERIFKQFTNESDVQNFIKKEIIFKVLDICIKSLNNIPTEKNEKKTENVDPILKDICKDVYFTFKYDLSEKIEMLFSENIINKEMDPDSLKHAIYDNLVQDEIYEDIYKYILSRYSENIKKIFGQFKNEDVIQLLIAKKIIPKVLDICIENINKSNKKNKSTIIENISQPSKPFNKELNLISILKDDIDLNEISTKENEKKTENFNPIFEKIYYDSILQIIYEDVCHKFKNELFAKIKKLFSENIIDKKIDINTLKHKISETLSLDEIYDYILTKHKEIMEPISKQFPNKSDIENLIEKEIIFKLLDVCIEEIDEKENMEFSTKKYKNFETSFKNSEKKCSNLQSKLKETVKNLNEIIKLITKDTNPKLYDFETIYDSITKKSQDNIIKILIDYYSNEYYSVIYNYLEPFLDNETIESSWGKYKNFETSFKNSEKECSNLRSKLKETVKNLNEIIKLTTKDTNPKLYNFKTIYGSITKNLQDKFMQDKFMQDNIIKSLIYYYSNEYCFVIYNCFKPLFEDEKYKIEFLSGKYKIFASSFNQFKKKCYNLRSKLEETVKYLNEIIKLITKDTNPKLYNFKTIYGSITKKSQKYVIKNILNNYYPIIANAYLKRYYDILQNFLEKPQYYFLNKNKTRVKTKTILFDLKDKFFKSITNLNSIIQLLNNYGHLKLSSIKPYMIYNPVMEELLPKEIILTITNKYLEKHKNKPNNLNSILGELRAELEEKIPKLNKIMESIRVYSHHFYNTEKVYEYIVKNYFN